MAMGLREKGAGPRVRWELVRTAQDLAGVDSVREARSSSLDRDRAASGTIAPLVVAASGAIVFALLLLLEKRGVTASLNTAVDVWLQTHDPDRFDPVAKFISLSGKDAVVGVGGVAMSLWLWRRGGRLAWLAPSVLVLAALAEILAKQSLPSPGSVGEYVRSALSGSGGRESGTSFPGGHVARATCLALLGTSLSSRTAWRAPLYALIVLAFLAGSYAGGHSVSDTLGGVALGTSTGALGIAWVRWRDRH